METCSVSAGTVLEILAAHMTHTNDQALSFETIGAEFLAGIVGGDGTDADCDALTRAAYQATENARTQIVNGQGTGPLNRLLGTTPSDNAAKAWTAADNGCGGPGTAK